MSSYKKQTKNPRTGEFEEAEWLDNAFGEHQYGVLFPSDIEAFPDQTRASLVHHTNGVAFEVKNDEPELPSIISQLTALQTGERMQMGHWDAVRVPGGWIFSNSFSPIGAPMCAFVPYSSW